MNGKESYIADNGRPHSDDDDEEVEDKERSSSMPGSRLCRSDPVLAPEAFKALSLLRRAACRVVLLTSARTTGSSSGAGAQEGTPAEKMTR